MTAERWPPTYDFEQLAKQIERLVRDQTLYKRFYANTTDAGPICQGDIVALQADMPILDEHGEAVADTRFDRWLVIGDTCDFERVEVEWSQIVPVVTIPPAAVTPDLAKVRSYVTYRRFYLPPWPASNGDHGIAELITPVTVDKRCLRAATVEARLDWPGWILLHSCLVRFLARGDGRFDGTP